MRPWQRFTAIEYAKPSALHEEIAKRSDVSASAARELLLRAGDRVRGILGLESVPLSINADRFQFQNVAGLLVLASGLELEIAPKFLGSAPGWREDFFFLATLSHHGRLLDNEGLKSSASATSDLATLIGRSLVEMYWKNQRRPLRTYRRLPHSEFAIEGDFDPEDLSVPTEEGFSQSVTSFTRENPYNAVIRAAAAGLAPIVPDVETRVRLERLAQHLPHQQRPSRLQGRRMPSRSRAWQPTFDLSLDILRGLGGAYDPKNALAPGYVMQTWQVWEQLVSLSLRNALMPKNVLLQSPSMLGTRTQDGAVRVLNVVPDAIATVADCSGPRRIIVDAKYKGHVDRSATSISNADIYESLAFSRATGISEVVLVYPRPVKEAVHFRDEVGHAAEFSRVEADSILIRAVEVGVRGISGRSGLKNLTEALRRVL
jgi:5-methylcytosine-specific restriction enzyme subunit McrC